MLSRIALQNTFGSGPFIALRPFTGRLMSSAPSTETTPKKAKVTILGKNNPDSVFYVGPERDLVNFPRRTRFRFNLKIRLSCSRCFNGVEILDLDRYKAKIGAMVSTKHFKMLMIFSIAVVVQILPVNLQRE